VTVKNVHKKQCSVTVTVHVKKEEAVVKNVQTEEEASLVNMFRQKKKRPWSKRSDRGRSVPSQYVQTEKEEPLLKMFRQKKNRP
jgi:hypothetical protein